MGIARVSKYVSIAGVYTYVQRFIMVKLDVKDELFRETEWRFLSDSDDKSK